jgi:hypothetical protein
VSSGQTVVLIAGHDAATGDRSQVQCLTDSHRVTTDVLLVDLKDLSNVVSGMCTVASDPEPDAGVQPVAVPAQR